MRLGHILHLFSCPRSLLFKLIFLCFLYSTVMGEPLPQRQISNQEFLAVVVGGAGYTNCRISCSAILGAVKLAVASTKKTEIALKLCTIISDTNPLPTF